MTDDSFRADRNDVMEMRPANSNPGFASVSLRVPSCDPLPSNDASRVHLTVPAPMERPPGRMHAYHTLEPPNLASGRTGGGSGREEGPGREAGGVVALNPDNRTNLREVTQHFEGTPQDNLGRNERFCGSFSTQPKTLGAIVSSPQQAKLKIVNSRLPPIPVIRSAEEGEVGYINATNREKVSEDPHKYDDIDLKDVSLLKAKAEADGEHYVNTVDRKKNPDGYDEIELKDRAAIKAKLTAESNSEEHGYDVLDDDKGTPTSRFLVERETVYTAHVLKPSPQRDGGTKQQVPAAREAVYTPHVLKPNPPGHKEDAIASSEHQLSASKETASSGLHGSEDYDDVILLHNKDTAADKKHAEGPMPSHGHHLIRRTTYSSTSNPAFDDPKYDIAFSGSEENSLPRGAPNITSSLGEPPPPLPRTQSLIQERKSRAPRQDYELTENLTVGDLSEPEHWREATPSLPMATKSSDGYECTKLFDDPEYGLGLNLKRHY